MAVDDVDPTTGRPIFLDGGAPDIAVDPTEVAKYAADVGNRIVRANLAALEAYPHKRAGLQGYAEDTGIEYLHNGTGWAQVGASRWVPITSLGTGWSIPPNQALIPEVRRFGDLVVIRGFVVSGPGVAFENLATLPAGFAPDKETWYGYTRGSSNSTAQGMLAVSPVGLIRMPDGYRSGSFTPGQYLSLTGTFSR